MNTHQPTLRSYVIGYGISLVTTLFAFWAAFHLGSYAVPAVAAAALVQLAAQLWFFLHMGSGPRAWRITGIFTAVILSMLIIGTIWIMHNLARFHHHKEDMTPSALYEHGIVAPEHELR